MTAIVRVPGAQDVRWQDHEWRTATLKRLCSKHKLDASSLAKITGRSENTVRFWLTAHKTAIGATTLRSVMFELNARKS
jgi:tellurite resistance protein